MASCAGTSGKPISRKGTDLRGIRSRYRSWCYLEIRKWKSRTKRMIVHSMAIIRINPIKSKVAQKIRSLWIMGYLPNVSTAIASQKPRHNAPTQQAVSITNQDVQLRRFIPTPYRYRFIDKDDHSQNACKAQQGRLTVVLVVEAFTAH